MGRIGDNLYDVHQLAMYPTEPNTIFAACGKQGIFKTMNGGETWTKRNIGLIGLVQSKFNFHTIEYISLAIDSTNPDTIYAGTGKRRGQIYKSLDGGGNWIKLTGNEANTFSEGWWMKKDNWPGNVGFCANCLSIDPRNCKRVYLSGKSGVWRSEDGGTTWHAKVKGLEATCMNKIVINPQKEHIIFVATLTGYSLEVWMVGKLLCIR